MRVLLTGCTAAQSSQRKNDRSTTFAGLFNRFLQDNGHTVTWTEPSIHMTKDYLSEFDSVLVGLAPPTSTAAHRIYGALSVISYARSLGNLSLLLDAPDPYRVWIGLRAVYNKPEMLTKDFYSKRKEYDAATDDFNLSRLRETISQLYTEVWPKTIFPSTPWMSYPSVTSHIPMLDRSDAIGVNLDSYVLHTPPTLDPALSEGLEPHTYWVSDAYSSKWTKSMEPLVKNQVVAALKSKWEGDESVLTRMSSAVGTLASTYRNGDPWWSVAIPQSLSLGVPVVTDWRLTSHMGDSWRHLAASVELMSDSDRRSLSTEQRSAYEASLMSVNDTATVVQATLFR